MKKKLIAILVLVVIAITVYFYFRPIPLIEKIDNASVQYLGYNLGDSQTEEITDYKKENLLDFLSTCEKRRMLFHANTGNPSHPLDIVIIMDGDNPTIKLGRYVNTVQSNEKYYKMLDAEDVLKTLHEMLGIAQRQEG